MREKQYLNNRGTVIKRTVDFSPETMDARKPPIKVLKEKDCQPRILYPARLSFKDEGEINPFSDKEKLSEFITGRPALQEILRGSPPKTPESDSNLHEEIKSIKYKCTKQ